MRTVDEASLAAAIAGTRPVVVDFSATWCGPCRPVAMLLGQMATETDAVDFVKVDADDNPELVARHGVRAMPTVAVFAGGVEVKRVVGFRGGANLRRELEPFV